MFFFKYANNLSHPSSPFPTGATIDESLKSSPRNSEVHSYKGELHFTSGDIASALKEFEIAIECEPLNPTPYVNAALAVQNQQPTPGGTPDFARAIEYFNKALEVDPQFQAAYIHLGQLMLSLAKSLDDAIPVIELYEKGIRECRTEDETRDIVRMRVLAKAQLRAAVILGMKHIGL